MAGNVITVKPVLLAFCSPSARSSNRSPRAP
jgi:hypothetical protein